MKSLLLTILLGIAILIAIAAVFSSKPRRLVLGWLGVGFVQSAFLLVVGFELLALLNLLFVFASATVLQIYSALFGTRTIGEVERATNRRDWIVGIGVGLTVAAILGFAAIGTRPETDFAPDLDASVFAKELLVSFPELPWVLGVTLFLSIVVWASVGRPGWKPSREGSA